MYPGDSVPSVEEEVSDKLRVYVTTPSDPIIPSLLRERNMFQDPSLVPRSKDLNVRWIVSHRSRTKPRHGHDRTLRIKNFSPKWKSKHVPGGLIHRSGLVGDKLTFEVLPFLVQTDEGRGP